MSRADLIEMQGRITKVNAKGNFIVTTDEGLEVRTRLSGRMRRYKIRVVLGDHVTIGVSPYDPTRGFITYRKK